MNALEDVRSGDESHAIPIAQQPRSSERLKPALIDARQRHSALE